jgi:transposase
MRESYYIGLDSAKNNFQVFTADGKGREMSNKKLTRSAMMTHFARLPKAVVGIEACATAHHWARTLTAFGHTVKLINPQRVKAFLGSRNKTDAADAKAICEALMHPGTTFIRAKSLEEQDFDHLLARRELLVQNRTQLVNQTRAFLSERGIVIPQGRHNFMKNLPQIIAEKWDEFSGKFQGILTDNYSDYQDLGEKIAKLDKMIVVEAANTEPCKRLMKMNGIGPQTALALFAHVGNAQHFKNGRQMAAYFGLTPREHSSGGKQRLLGITKRGNVRLRTLFILGARAAILGLGRRKKGEDGQPCRGLNPFDRWILNMVAKIGLFKAAVALANKMCRIAWALLARGEEFNPLVPCRLAKAG